MNYIFYYLELLVPATFASGTSAGTVSSVDVGATLTAAAETGSPSSDGTTLSKFDGDEARAAPFDDDGCSEHAAAAAAASFGGCAIQSLIPFSGTTVFGSADMTVLFYSKVMRTCECGQVCTREDGCRSTKTVTKK